MKFKKLLIASIALLGLASVSGISANASSQYAKRYMKVYRYYPSRAFYDRVNLNHYTHIHRGQRISVRPFYHMGHDGFTLHIYGRYGTYYARTNSYRWYKNKKNRRHVRSHRRHKHLISWQRFDSSQKRFNRQFEKETRQQEKQYHDEIRKVNQEMSQLGKD